MGGRIKALARLGGQTLLERAVAALRQGGIENIVAVAGHDRERVEREAARLGIRVAANPDIDRGMFSSLRIALALLAPEAPDAVLILPVDAALVRARTVAALRALREETRANPLPPILIPTFLGLPGHPVLIPAAHIEPLLRWSGEKGLRGYLDSLSPAAPGTAPALISCSLPDAGITSDLDTPAQLAEAEAFLEETDNRALPSLEEAWQELALAEFSPDKVRHSLQVAAGAARLARGLADGTSPFPGRLAEAGTRLAPLCLRAGLLHDICRKQPDHAARGAERLLALGWRETAFAVGAHTALPAAVLKFFSLGEDGAAAAAFPPGEDAEISARSALAAACVYLADKLTPADRPEPVRERFARARERFARDPEALAAVSRREALALALEKWFAGVLPRPPREQILNTPPDKEEERLAALARSDRENIPAGAKCRRAVAGKGGSGPESILYLIRHGRAGPPGVLLGRTDPPLSPCGEAEVLAWRPFFRLHPLDAVWTSPLLRARRTAELLREPASPGP
jgi:CTP:molybdopterin cytidylyltransferase MocA/HD superfamily phosphodiesterase